MWKDLTLNLKSDLMKLYVLNGITDLDKIISHYNEFKRGGTMPIMPGAYIAKGVQKLKNKYLVDYVNKGLVWDYPKDIKSLIKDYLLSPYNSSTEYMHSTDEESFDNWRRAILAKYLGLDKDKGIEFNPDEYIVESVYKPSKSKNDDAKYYTYNTNRENLRLAFKMFNGKHKVDFGEDSKGKYVSFYDIWDLNPFEKINNKRGSNEDTIGKIVGGIPIEFYDRLYESDSPNQYKYIWDSYHTNIDQTNNKSLGGRLFSNGGSKGTNNPFEYARNLYTTNTMSADFARELNDLVNARNFGFAPEVLAHGIGTESGYNVNAKNPNSTAKGIFLLTRTTLRQMYGDKQGDLIYNQYVNNKRSQTNQIHDAMTYILKIDDNIKSNREDMSAGRFKANLLAPNSAMTAKISDAVWQHSLTKDLRNALTKGKSTYNDLADFYNKGYDIFLEGYNAQKPVVKGRKKEFGGYLANEFKDGGIKERVKNKLIDFWYKRNILPAIDKLGIDEVRYRLYKNISPYGYLDAKKRIKSALKDELPEFEAFLQDRLKNEIFTPERDDIFATYLLIPEDKRRNINSNKVEPSEYSPTKSNNFNSSYYKVNLTDDDKYNLIFSALSNINDQVTNNKHLLVDTFWQPINQGESRISTLLRDYFGTHTLSRGFDDKGDYVSYYDLWDLAPVGGYGSDQTHGIGKAIEFYDRLYFDDYFDVPNKHRGGHWLPEIEIKPEKID